MNKKYALSVPFVPPFLRKKRLLWLWLLTAAVFVPSSAEPAVSILPFENLSEDPALQWMARSLADGLSSSLQGAALTLVDRSGLDDLIREQKLSLSGLTDQAAAPEVGRLLNAAQFIRGSYLREGGVLRVSARITDTASGEILYSLSREAPPEEYFALEQSIAQGLGEFYGTRSGGLPPAHQTASVEALSRYYDGLDLLDARSYEQAAEAFRLSSREDPFFLPPRNSLEESYRFLREFRKARRQRELNDLYGKLSRLLRRAAARPFEDYPAQLARLAREGRSPEEIAAHFQERPELTWGATPAETLWHAQRLTLEIAAYAEDAENPAEAAKMYEMTIALSRRQARDDPSDPFLPELLYQELSARRRLAQWPQVRRLCESLMTNYPDFRMIWAVEELYEQALEEQTSP